MEYKPRFDRWAYEIMQKVDINEEEFKAISEWRLDKFGRKTKTYKRRELNKPVHLGGKWKDEN